jgi:hypothetical protein
MHAGLHAADRAFTVREVHVGSFADVLGKAGNTRALFCDPRLVLRDEGVEGCSHRVARAFGEELHRQAVRLDGWVAVRD